MHFIETAILIILLEIQMSELKELEKMIGCIDEIKDLDFEPDFSSLGIEPPEVLGFKNNEELEKALRYLMSEKTYDPLFAF